MRIPIYNVDAFTRSVFGGNPAAVCLLDSWLDDATLQNIAAENNLSETAFLVRGTEAHELRWFTPSIEIDLCGHATLATAFVLFSCLGEDADTVAFDTASGRLTVARDGDILRMDFPARKPEPVQVPEDLVAGLGRVPVEAHRSRDLLALLETEADVRNLVPDMAALARIPDVLAVIVTAPGDSVDFVSRFFAPAAGIAEDPVTGSSHCTLIPYWAERLGKTTLHARQVSARGGELFCEHMGERVHIGGHAVLYSSGEVIL